MEKENPPQQNQRRMLRLGCLLGFFLFLIPLGIFVGTAGMQVARLILHMPSGQRSGEVPQLEGQEAFDAAMYLTQTSKFSEAIPYWDLVLEADPANGTAYYYRALCYRKLAINQRYLEEYQRYVSQALSDIDQAIGLGADARQPGDTYNLRYYILDDLAGITPRRTDREMFAEASLENLRTAMALGTTDKNQKHTIPLVLFSLRQCAEGLAALQQIRENYSLSAPPSVSLLNLEAHGYLCKGQFEKALEMVDKGLEIQNVSEHRWLRMIILAMDGQVEEALIEITQDIDHQPSYNGDRYFLRALLYLEMGQQDLVEADLQLGRANAWDGWGLEAYVRGLIAVQAGDKEMAIRQLSWAYETLDWYYLSLLPKIEGQLAELGAAVPPETTTLTLEITPMPTVEFRPTTAAGMVLANGLPEPPNLVPIEFKAGTGDTWTSSDYPFPVYHFLGLETLQLDEIKSLTIHLEPYSRAMSEAFELFVWNLTTGEWALYKPGWGEVQIENPEAFVGVHGDVYFSIRTDEAAAQHIQNFWVTIEAVQTDGTPLHLGLEP